MKTCTSCKLSKPKSDYYKRKNRPIGIMPSCKDCSKKRQTKWTQTTFGIYKIISNRSSVCLYEEFNNWHSQQVKICHYCGIPEELWQHLFKDKKKKYALRLTIDRLDNSIGYITENMVLACLFCNRVKNELFTENEMFEIAEKYIKPKWQSKIKKAAEPMLKEN